MGRAQNQQKAIAPMLGLRGSEDRIERVIADLSTGPNARLLARYQRKLRGVDVSAVADPEKRDELRSRAVGIIPQEEQRRLIGFHQTLTHLLKHARANEPTTEEALQTLEEMRRETAEMFVLANRGILYHWMKEHGYLIGQMEERDPKRARETAYQEARSALITVLRRFNTRSEANPMTYAHAVVFTVMRTMLERERGPVAFKSRLRDAASRLDTAIRAVKRERGEDAVLSIAELADRAKVSVEHVAQILPHMQAPVRMDAPARVWGVEDGSYWTSDEGRGGVFVEDHDADVEAHALSADQADAVTKALGRLSPFRRALVEAQYGFDGIEVEQRHLYSGVYVDSDGVAYSAEPTVLRTLERAGDTREVREALQSELNRRYKAAELRWEPFTPETRRVGQLLAAERRADDAAQMAGLPLSSGLVQGELVAAEAALCLDPGLAAHRPRYRGEHELERSGAARALMLRALKAVGDVDEHESRKLLRVGRDREDGSHIKPAIRLLAEKRGWVDERGRLSISEAQVKEFERVKRETYERVLAERLAAGQSPDLSGTPRVASRMAASASAHRTGRPARDPVIERRLQAAKEMIERHPGAKLGEIAAELGFGSQAQFSSAFSRRFGMTPKQARTAAP